MLPSGTPFNVRIFVLILIELFATEVGMPGRDGGLLLAWFCWRFRPELVPEGGTATGVQRAGHSVVGPRGIRHYSDEASCGTDTHSSSSFHCMYDMFS